MSLLVARQAFTLMLSPNLNSLLYSVPGSADVCLHDLQKHKAKKHAEEQAMHMYDARYQPDMYQVLPPSPLCQPCLAINHALLSTLVDMLSAMLVSSTRSSPRKTIAARRSVIPWRTLLMEGP